VFYPQPKVTSALLSLNFTGAAPAVSQEHLKRVLRAAFQQRRKMLRQSMKPLFADAAQPPAGFEVFATRRPEQLTPQEFVQLTQCLLGDSSEGEQGSAVWRTM
jgi:16S rRNA (adenine1518-N6/adenine1519-N6)-dimethyltransferase